MKIGMTVSKDTLQFPIAGHFGKAKWLLVWDGSGAPTFLPNTGLNGGFVADTFAQEGCTDVIVLQLGGGAFQHLMTHGLRVWQADEPAPPAELVRKLEQGTLRRLEEAPPHGHGGHGAGHQGCC